MSEEGVERRLTTILAVDVVGYSRLMAADEAGTLMSLKAIRRELFEPKTSEASATRMQHCMRDESGEEGDVLASLLQQFTAEVFIAGVFGVRAGGDKAARPGFRRPCRRL